MAKSKDNMKWRGYMAKEHLPKEIREMKLDNIANRYVQNGKATITIDNHSLTDLLIAMLRDYSPDKITTDSNYGEIGRTHTYFREIFDIPYDEDAKLIVDLYSSSSEEIWSQRTIVGITHTYELGMIDKTKKFGLWMPKNKINIRLKYDIGDYSIPEYAKGIQNYNSNEFSPQFKKYFKRYIGTLNKKPIDEVDKPTR